MYILIEMQTTGGATALLPALTYDRKAEAVSAWHQKMAAAAISSVEVHTVLLLDEHGNNVSPGKPWYEHIAEAAV